MYAIGANVLVNRALYEFTNLRTSLLMGQLTQ